MLVILDHTGDLDLVLRKPVYTTRENEVRLRPFQVLNVRTRQRWDPSEETLWVTWDINDPNDRVVSGRIRYEAYDQDGNDVTIHTQRLDAAQTRHGKGHKLPRGQRWDGEITEGLTDRIGEKVTADLSPVQVVVEVWNTAFPEPATEVRHGRGRTERQGEWLAAGMTETEIDAIVKARWDRRFVVPHGDPDEPDKGEAKMIVRVKNVREGTPAYIEVFRINDIAKPTSDHPYPGGDYTGDQPGLEELVVKPGKRNMQVLRPDGSAPSIRFDDFSEHWKHPGNNFYAFSVRFGQFGRLMAASERDHVKRERRCLHMRFTVFIHCAAPGGAYQKCADELWKFLKRDTEYFRPYLLTGVPTSATEWYKRYHHRYIVVVLGHGGALCYHKDHPTVDQNGHKKKLKMYSRGYDPDGYVCAAAIENTAEARKEHDNYMRMMGPGPYGGCGHASHVYHCTRLGPASKTGRNVCIAYPPGESSDELPRVLFNNPRELYKFGGPDEHPRLFFYTGACRQVVTKNMGERFTRHGTRYFHGWAWAVFIDPPEQGNFCLDLFRKWIKGSKVEYDVDRFYRAYCATAKRSYVTSHPRLMEERNVLNARPGPDKIEMVLE